MSLFFCWFAANIQINTHTHFYTDIYINAANHLETDILCPLLQHKWGQSHTHSTTNERGDPPKLPRCWSLEQPVTSCLQQPDWFTHVQPSRLPPQPRKPISNPNTPSQHVPPSVCWTFTPSHIPCIPHTHWATRLSTGAASCVISDR